MSKASRDEWRKRQTDTAAATAPEADTPPELEHLTAPSEGETAASGVASDAAPDLLALLAAQVESGAITREQIRAALERPEPAPPKIEPLQYHWACFRCTVVPGMPALCASCAKQERNNLNVRAAGAVRACPPSVPPDAWAAAIDALLRTKARTGKAPAPVLTALLDTHLPVFTPVLVAAFEAVKTAAEAAE